MGYYNSTYGSVHCPGQESDAVQQNSVECQPCGDCLDCKTIDTDHVVLVRPGFALGSAAMKIYQGVERGTLHEDKVLHKCVRDMCIGETTGSAVSLAVTVNTNTDSLNVATSEERIVFDREVSVAVAGVLGVSSEDITVDSIVAAPGSSDLRRWLQSQAHEVVIGFTVAVAADSMNDFLAKVEELRLASDAAISMQSGSTVIMSTLTPPISSRTYVLAGIRCRAGHDSALPLCRVCQVRSQRARALNLVFRGQSRCPTGLSSLWLFP
jgi:hypothetical protein